MILLDTSVWVDHLRRSDGRVAAWLAAGHILAHPFITGEIACGHLPRRQETLRLLETLPAAASASHAEVLAFIDRQSLAGRGVNYIDLHLLASTMMTPQALLWTRDRRMREVADLLGVLFDEKGA